MGYVKQIKPVFLSCEDIVLESGKLMKFYWRDNTMNNVIRRIPKWNL